jgi:hypothetical protein
MLNWIRNHLPIIAAVFVVGMLALYQYGCEPTVKSLIDDKDYVNREELTIELNALMAKAELRMVQLDRQDELRNILINNALLIAQGNPTNPLGLLTALAGLYGLGSGAVTIRKKVVSLTTKGKNNGVNT